METRLFGVNSGHDQLSMSFNNGKLYYIFLLLVMVVCRWQEGLESTMAAKYLSDWGEADSCLVVNLGLNYHPAILPGSMSGCEGCFEKG